MLAILQIPYSVKIAVPLLAEPEYSALFYLVKIKCMEISPMYHTSVPNLYGQYHTLKILSNDFFHSQTENISFSNIPASLFSFSII